MERDTDLVPPLIIAGILALAFVLVSGMDFAEALTAEAIRKDPPRVLAYSIKQDSPGLDHGQPMLPLHSPVADAKPAPKKHRRSTTEQR